MIIFAIMLATRLILENDTAVIFLGLFCKQDLLFAI
jgi:hypothetical protein